MGNPIAANVLGTAGAICWSVQLIPQIIINHRRQNTTGLQASMMMLWAWAGVPLGVYNITKQFNVALRIQPQILTTLSLITWIQCQYYAKGWSITRCAAIVSPIVVLMAGIQAGLIFALREAARPSSSSSSASTWPETLMAALSAALLAAGVLRHYWDIYTYRSVRGISFLFVAIDAAGDLFSLISIFFQPALDVLGIVIYGTELALWIGVLIAGGHYRLVPWVRKRKGERKRRDSKKTSASNGQTHATADISSYDMSGMPANGIMLRNLPSSTSVFRTTSGDSSNARARVGFSAAGNTGMDPSNQELQGSIEPSMNHSSMA